MSILKNYPSGSNQVMLLNTMYHRAKKGDNGKYGNDSLSIIYKDLVTKEKKIEYIVKPEIDIYVAKPEVFIEPGGLGPENIELNKVDKYTFPFQNLLLNIAELAGNDYVQHYWNKVKAGQFSATKRIHHWRRLFGSDWDIEDYYRYRFYRDFEKPLIKLTKGYLDIEVDTRKVTDFDKFFKIKDVAHPVTAISFYEQETNVQYVLLLRDSRNNQIRHMENNLSAFFILAHEMFDKTFGYADYKVFFFDDERELIRSIFSIINRVKTDFVLAWNMAFDIPYLITRLTYLGCDPNDIICHPDFPVKECYYYIDKRNIDFSDRGDFFKCSSYTVYVDQMILYATIRKGRAEIESMKLDFVAKHEVGEGKIDFADEGNLNDLMMNNYMLYVLYNIKDTRLQSAIEKKAEDVENLYDMAYDNTTRYHKAYRQSIYLKNRSYIYHIDQGYVPGNNKNIQYEYDIDDDSTEEKEKAKKFQGAIVCDPELNLKRGLNIHGKPSKYIFTDVMDADYASLYPNIIYAFNISVSTQWGKVRIHDTISPYENLLADPKYDRGGEFIEDYSTKNPVLLGKKWMNLPGLTDIYDKIINKISNQKIEYKNNVIPIDDNVNVYNSEGELCDVLYIEDNSVSNSILTVYVKMLEG